MVDVLAKGEMHYYINKKYLVEKVFSNREYD